MPTVFLSYASADRVRARDLAQALRQRGVDVWLDLDQLELASEWRSEIRKAISRADCVLVLITPTSLSSSSVAHEWAAALRGSRRVVPVLAGGARFDDLNGPLAGMHGVDLGQDPDGIEKLLEAIDVGDGDDAAEEPLPRTSLDIEKVVDVTVEQLLGRLDIDRNDRTEQIDDLVFVIIAFSSDMDPVYEAISEAADAVGLRAMRVKDHPGDYKIDDRIVELIRQARLIVADLTHERPNVYFELGYARGLGKTVVTIAKRSTPIHFDVRSWTYIEYIDSRPLQRDLAERFKYELDRHGDG